MLRIEVNTALARERIKPIDERVNTRLVADRAKYKQLISRLNNLDSEDAFEGIYDLLEVEAEAIESVRRAYAALLAQIEDVVMVAEERDGTRR